MSTNASNARLASQLSDADDVPVVPTKRRRVLAEGEQEQQPMAEPEPDQAAAVCSFSFHVGAQAEVSTDFGHEEGEEDAETSADEQQAATNTPEVVEVVEVTESDEDEDAEERKELMRAMRRAEKLAKKARAQQAIVAGLLKAKKEKERKAKAAKKATKSSSTSDEPSSEAAKKDRKKKKDKKAEKKKARDNSTSTTNDDSSGTAEKKKKDKKKDTKADKKKDKKADKKTEKKKDRKRAKRSTTSEEEESGRKEKKRARKDEEEAVAVVSKNYFPRCLLSDRVLRLVLLYTPAETITNGLRAVMPARLDALAVQTHCFLAHPTPRRVNLPDFRMRCLLADLGAVPPNPGVAAIPCPESLMKRVAKTFPSSSSSAIRPGLVRVELNCFPCPKPWHVLANEALEQAREASIALCQAATDAAKRTDPSRVRKFKPVPMAVQVLNSFRARPLSDADRQALKHPGMKHTTETRVRGRAARQPVLEELCATPELARIVRDPRYIDAFRRLLATAHPDARFAAWRELVPDQVVVVDRFVVAHPCVPNPDDRAAKLAPVIFGPLLCIDIDTLVPYDQPSLGWVSGAALVALEATAPSPAKARLLKSASPSCAVLFRHAPRGAESLCPELVVWCGRAGLEVLVHRMPSNPNVRSAWTQPPRDAMAAGPLLTLDLPKAGDDDDSLSEASESSSSSSEDNNDEKAGEVAAEEDEGEEEESDESDDVREWGEAMPLDTNTYYIEEAAESDEEV